MPADFATTRCFKARRARALCAALLLGTAVLAGGCATVEPRPAPLTQDEIVALSKSGEPPAEIIRRLRESRTVLLLSASDIVKLHDAGVAPEVLDYLQRVQIRAIRERDAIDRAFAWPGYPFASPFSCGWPAYGGVRPYPFGGPRWPYC
jgi:hypothetical protein